MSTPRPPASRDLPAERRALPAAFFAQRRPVVSVSAPAGYGKSSLLAFWQHLLAAQDCRIVALTVNAGDRGEPAARPAGLAADAAARLRSPGATMHCFRR